MSRERSSGSDRPSKADPIIRRDEAKSHAEAIRTKEWIPVHDPFLIAANALVGMKLRESRLYGELQLAFDETPSPAVVEKLTENGYGRDPLKHVWTHPVRTETARATLRAAEKLFQEVAKMIGKERGLTAFPGIS